MQICVTLLIGGSFWKTVKPVFRNNVKTCDIISLIKKSTAITSEEKLVKIFSEFSLRVNIVPNLLKHEM